MGADRRIGPVYRILAAEVSLLDLKTGRAFVGDPRFAKTFG